MTNELNAPDAVPVRPVPLPDSAAESGSAQQRLKGRIGVIELVLTVLAWSAPIMVVSAVTPFMISFGGIGAPLAYVIAMAILLVFSVGYTAMTRHVDNPGAFYAYITAGLGKAPGLGASFLAIAGYLFMAVASYMFIGTAVANLAGELGLQSIPWYALALLVVGITGTLGYFRIDLSAKVLSIVMVCEILIVVIFDAGVLGQGGPEGIPFAPFSWDALASGSVGVAVLYAALSFGGFEATAIFREETKDPGRTVPRATYLAVGSFGVFYIAATWLMIVAYGPANVGDVAASQPTSMFASAVEKFVGTWAKDVVTVLVVTSAFAALLSVQNIISRYCYSLGIDGVLPARMGKVHPRHGSPYVSSLTLSLVLIVALLAFAGSDPEAWYGQLAGTGGFAIMVLMTLTSAAVILFFQCRRDARDASRWHTTVAPLLSVVGMVVVLYLAITNFTTMTGGSVVEAAVEQAIVWGVLVAGFVIAWIYRSKRPMVYARIGRQKA
ncbi:APC family permease [Pseudonocardia kujensis]|uniref:APC family permease n=1 Tax=Pseudonocardia kujensis TaxID=1128675 RepID=UPI001E2F6155|nr:APC family permease [Pseudonocardia kujensis]MCE0768598.1 APC family permease [Pseudonocardia kujensis]